MIQSTNLEKYDDPIRVSPMVTLIRYTIPVGLAVEQRDDRTRKTYKSLKYWRRGAEFPGSGDIRGVLTGFEV